MTNAERGFADEAFVTPLLDALACPAAVVDSDGGVVAINRRWLLAHPSDASSTDRERGPAPDAPVVSEAASLARAGIQAVLNGDRSCFTVDYANPVSGDEQWFTFTAARLSEVPGGAVLAHTDITEREQFEAQLNWQAHHDPLTGLANRVLLLDCITNAVRRMAQQRLQLAVLFVAVDLNVINDSMGHTAGDSIMTEFAGRLEGLLRPGDLAGHFGGNEFVVVCEDIASEKEASAVAARLLDLLREPFQVGLIPLTVSASVGVIVAGANDDAETLLRDADAAMDQARESGRNQYALFESGIRLRAVARLETEELLRLAIDRSELELLYQPIVRLSDERVVAVEALLRWNHPQRGLVGPDQFIPLLEQTGLIIPVGSWVIAEACRQAERWCQFAGDEPPVGMHVNVSVHQLTHPALFDAVYEGLRSTSTDPARLTLEVTESMLMRDTETYLESFLGLKAHAGVKLAIDDFGTGYSPLGYLRDFPTDCLKIDKSFVQQLAGRKRGSEAIVGAVVGMANAMGITAVAEGVETEAQLGALRALGCGFAQGYRYSPPVPAEAIDVLLREASGWRAR